jgi:Family of unknown function (DUF6958)
MTQKKRLAAQRPSRRSSDTGGDARVAVENVNHPGSTRLVDASLYQAMRRALLKALPSKGPGLTLADLSRAVLDHLPQDTFPDGAKAGWWLKTVQLDLEAKGIIAREKTTPLRLHRL